MYNQKFGEQRVKQMIPMMTVGKYISGLCIAQIQQHDHCLAAVIIIMTEAYIMQFSTFHESMLHEQV